MKRFRIVGFRWLVNCRFRWTYFRVVVNSRFITTFNLDVGQGWFIQLNSTRLQKLIITIEPGVERDFTSNITESSKLKV